MNIGIITVWGERGAGYVSNEYFKYLSNYFNVFIYNRGYIKDIPDKKEYIYNAKKISSFKPMSINRRELKTWIDRNNIETILFNEQQSWEPILWCKKWKIKTIAYIDYYKEDTVELHDAYDMLFCNTKRHLDAFKGHSNAKYLKWGTDLDLFKPNENKNQSPVFFHSCGYSPKRKGTDLIIESINEIDLKFKLIIHSQVNLIKIFPKLESKIKKLIKREKLEIIIGTIKAPGLYNLADYYLYPSRLDGIGLSLLESISAGLIPITTNNPPMNEFLPKDYRYLINVNKMFSREDGYFWPQVEVSTISLKALIIDAIKTFPNKELKSNMREWALSNFNIKDNFSGIEKDIRDLKFSQLTTELENKIIDYELSRPINNPLLKKITNILFLKIYKIIKWKL